MENIEETIRKYNSHEWVPVEGRMAVLLIDLQDYFREDFPLSSLKNLGYGFAVLLTCDQFINSLRVWPSLIFITTRG